MSPVHTAVSLGLAVGVPDSIELLDVDAVLRLAHAVGGKTLVDTSAPDLVVGLLLGGCVARTRTALSFMRIATVQRLAAHMTGAGFPETFSKQKEDGE